MRLNIVVLCIYDYYNLLTNIFFKFEIVLSKSSSTFTQRGRRM